MPLFVFAGNDVCYRLLVIQHAICINSLSIAPPFKFRISKKKLIWAGNQEVVNYSWPCCNLSLLRYLSMQQFRAVKILCHGSGQMMFILNHSSE